ncbi:MAG: D-aminoacyl-tRNA deacylase [bacterium]
MKLVIQRVRRARVSVAGRDVASIGAGALILCGVARGDTPADAAYLARKTSQLRIYDDADGKMNLPIDPNAGAFLVVSQFTLYGDCAKGNRPSYIDAALPEDGRRLYEDYAVQLRALGHHVETGEFGANMVVELENDGPVTLILESRGRSGFS